MAWSERLVGSEPWFGADYQRFLVLTYCRRFDLFVACWDVLEWMKMIFDLG